MEASIVVQFCLYSHYRSLSALPEMTKYTKKNVFSYQGPPVSKFDVFTSAYQKCAWPGQNHDCNS